MKPPVTSPIADLRFEITRVDNARLETESILRLSSFERPTALGTTLAFSIRLQSNFTNPAGTDENLRVRGSKSAPHTGARHRTAKTPKAPRDQAGNS